MSTDARGPADRIGTLLDEVRRRSPVVHHLTNWVTIGDCAQIVKAFGASPVMAHAPEEVEEMVGIASALVLNIGTLTVELVEAMKKALREANRRGVPVVLDVCGAGATRLRDEKCRELLDEGHVDVVKGNASEVARIAGEAVTTRGVDATQVSGDLAAVARRLAAQRRCTVVATGAVDVVAGPDRTLLVANGDPLMGRVVGTGCMAASVIGTFLAVGDDHLVAAACGLACYEIAAELAARAGAGPGSFQSALLDAVATLDGATVAARHRVRAG